MEKTMNILFVVPYVPNLIRVRPYNLIRSLSRRGHQITLMTLWTDDRDLEDLEQLKSFCKQVLAYPLPRWRSLSNCVLTLPTDRPLQAVYCWSPDFSHAIQEQLVSGNEGEGYDVIHIEHLRGARYGQAIRSRWDGKSPPIVWDSVDSISYLFRQAAGQSQKLFNRMVTRFELPRTEKYEAAVTREFDRVLVTSEKDRDAFCQLGEIVDTEKLRILNNGVDLDYFSVGNFQERAENTLVVSGKLSYHANISMVHFMMEKIMPQVWESIPEVKLWIVGKDPPGDIQAYAKDQRIVVTGTVDDLRPYLQKATLAVAPVTYGAGIQNKVLEAMACATPVVSTPTAVAALELEWGDDVAIAEDQYTFAQTVIDLLQRPERRLNLARRGREYVERKHSWEAIAARLEKIYMDVIVSTNHFPAV